MNVLTYDYEKMKRAGELLNAICREGVNVDQCRFISEIGDILDSGKIAEIIGEEEKDHDSSRNAQNEDNGIMG